MKVLWLCNIVLPEFADEFGFKKINVGGWLSGMWSELNKCTDIQLGICCPIYNKDRMKDGILNNNKYYSFYFSSKSEYSNEQEIRFVEILNDFKPDIIHIWGTEYVHTLAMVNACEKCGVIDNAVINIQGLVSVYAKHYTLGLPYNIAATDDIQNGINDFINRGKFECEALNKIHHVIGRTDWDKACTMQINPNVRYHFCNEIIRDVFYNNAKTWEYDICEKHSIFVSQGNYPVKGLHYILEALPIILQRYPDSHVYISGGEANGTYSEYIKMIIKEKQLERYITFLGILSEEQMCEQFKRSNVFVSASTIENSPNSICEAMMIGVPVVSSMVGGVNCLIKHNDSGFLYQHDAPYMLAYYVCCMFSDIEKTTKMSQNAVDAAMKINNKESNLTTNKKIYKEMNKNVYS